MPSGFREERNVDKKGEEFIKQCNASSTSVSAFIKLFNMWDRMNSEQRGEVIDKEISDGRLFVEK